MNYQLTNVSCIVSLIHNIRIAEYKYNKENPKIIRWALSHICLLAHCSLFNGPIGNEQHE